ncbi:MAG: hypothetical protein Q4A70_01965 [Candidatus Saccharibacteria bacterium]|nr:hypothetical protein [Candidatus Saccharibacteria bacterium]
MTSHNYNKALIAPIGMVGLTILAGGFLVLPNVNADDSAVSTATITVPISCTMSGTGMNSHTASIENGRKVEGIGTTDIKAFCNDSEGFSIYAVGFTGDTIGNTYLRDTTLGQTDDILTSTTLSGNTSAWAMKLGATSGTYTPIIAGSTADSEKQAGDTDYSNWAAVPASYQRVAYRNSATDLDNGSTAEGAQLTTTYAAYISPTQKAGTYVGKVKYTLVHPANEMQPHPVSCIPNTICYIANSNVIEGSMGQQTLDDISEPIEDGSPVTLFSSNYSRKGYGFAGWSTSYDYSDDSGFYGTNQTIIAPNTISTEGLSLYAHWIESQGYLQDWDCPDNTTMPVGSVTALTDWRDNNTYAVAKLVDGNCWMMENLRLNNTAANNTDGSLSQGYAASLDYGSFVGLAAPEFYFNHVTSDTNLANSLYYIGMQEGTASMDIGTSGTPLARMPRYNNSNVASREVDYSGSGNVFSNSNYYSWPAAVADTAYYPDDNFNIEDTSICPKGWSLPTGGSSTNASLSDYWKLGVAIMGFAPSNDVQYQSSDFNSVGDTASRAFRKYPNNFLYSRIFTDSIKNNSGYYWASTSYNNGSSYFLMVGTTNLSPGTNNGSKKNGRSVRCVSRQV